MKPLLSLLTSGLLVAAFVGPSHAANDQAISSARVEVVRSLGTMDAALTVIASGSFRSTYEMESGHRLTIVAYGQSLRMRYADAPVETLRHDGNGRFVSPDQRTSLRFALNEHGDAETVTLSMPAR